MLFDDLLHDGEPEARAFRLRGHVRLERALQDVLFEAGSRIGELQQRLVLGFAERHLEMGIGGVGLRIDRVLQQVVHDLAQARRLAVDVNRRLR